ncbi:MAG: hypothetical protein NTX53_07990 [candidate division WOR-3 bacterium]|nr:hypothetical protein [candidate division WOR-3 bacterium]
MKHRPLLYLETSVFGFYYDEEPRNALRREAVRTLFDQIDLGVLHAAVSLLTVEELAGAREPVRTGLLSLVERLERLVVDSDEADRLTEYYMAEGIVPRSAAADARHAAIAAVAGAEVLVTLNLKHLANELTERRLNAVNTREGYPPVRIKTPEEVVRYED